MFGIDSTELLVIIVIAVIVIGPKDLPRALYRVGQIVGKAQGMARHFRTGIDAMVREVELEELEKKWAAQNRRIMQEHPSLEAPYTGSGEATPAEPDAGQDPADPADPSAGAPAEEPVHYELGSEPVSAFPGFPPPPRDEDEAPKGGAAA